MIKSIKINYPDFKLEVSEEFKKWVNVLEKDNWYGKAQPLWSNVLTPTWFKKIWDIQLWDTIISWRTWKQVKVLWIYPQWIKDVYKITTNKWWTCYASWEHLWEVIDMYEVRKSKKKKNWIKVINTVDLLSSWLTNRKHKVLRYKLPKIKNIEYNPIEKLYINPYVLWLLIADWSLHKPWVIFTNSEKDIVEKISSNILDDEIISEKIKEWKIDISIIKKEGSSWIWYKNTQTNTGFYLDYYWLKVKSIEKFIPEQYKFSSIKDRYELLQWLFDGDAHVPIRWSWIEYSTSSKQLFNDIKFILDSLWYNYITSNRIWKYKKNWITHECSISYTINITGEIDKLVSSYKHLSRIDKSKFKENDIFISSIEKYSEEECVCISVEDELYITDDFIVTHNTVILNTILSMYTGKYQWIGKKQYPNGTAQIVYTEDWKDKQALLMKWSWIGWPSLNPLYRWTQVWEFFRSTKSTNEQRDILVQLLWLNYDTFIANKVEWYYDWMLKELETQLKIANSNEWLILQDITRLEWLLFPIEEKVFPAIDNYNNTLKFLQDSKNAFNNNVYTKNAERNKLVLELSQLNNSIQNKENQLTWLRADYTSQEKAVCKTCNQSIPLDTNKLSNITTQGKQLATDIEWLKANRDWISNKINSMEVLELINDISYDKLADIFKVDFDVPPEEMYKVKEDYELSIVSQKTYAKELDLKKEQLKSLNHIDLESKIELIKEANKDFVNILETKVKETWLNVELFKVSKEWNVSSTFKIMNKEWIEYSELSTGNKLLLEIEVAMLFVRTLWLDLILIDEAAVIGKNILNEVLNKCEWVQIIMSKPTSWKLK